LKYASVTKPDSEISVARIGKLIEERVLVAAAE
jgi:hypothetical protein